MKNKITHVKNPYSMTCKAQDRDPLASENLSNPVCPAVHDTVSCRKRWHPLITLPHKKQMWMWTWKNGEGNTGRLCESVQKQCEDRNSSANRAVGTKRKCTLSQRRGHLTRGTMGHSQGFWLHSMCREGKREGAERTLLSAGQADWDSRGLGPTGQQNGHFMLKSR